MPDPSEQQTVLVDEYQDSYRAEQELIDLLSEDRSLAVIGEDDQP